MRDFIFGSESRSVRNRCLAIKHKVRKKEGICVIFDKACYISLGCK
jgi:hypothetical protein